MTGGSFIVFTTLISVFAAAEVKASSCGMNFSKIPMVLGLMVSAVMVRADSVATQYLQYVYGGDGVEIEKFCWPHDDLWMIRGQKNPAGLAQLAQEKITHGASEVLWENIQDDLCIIEIRDGKADPRFLLDQIHFRHRQLILQFVYTALRQDQEMMKKLTTKAANVRFGRAKPAAMGDLDVYEELIASLPVVRISSPAEDMKAKSVTYRVPLGKGGLALRLVKRGGTWLIDSDQRLDVPLDFFFR